MRNDKDERNPSDLVIIGGGPAGMSAALTAGRARLETVIVNAESPRNAATTASHGFLTRDGAHPIDLLATAKEQLTKYTTVSYLNDTVTGVTKTDCGFEIALGNGDHLAAKRLIIATGQVDDLDRLELPGIDDVYGKTVYPCIFCDGFEHRDERLAVFGREGAVHYAPMVRLWSEDLVVFTNGADLEPGEAATLDANGVTAHTGPIGHLESEDGRLLAVVLASGERIERDAGFISDDYSRPATTFAEQLGIASSPNDWGGISLDVDELGRSKIDGLYAIGDARIGFGGLVASAAEGAACVAEIVHGIAAERWNDQL